MNKLFHASSVNDVPESIEETVLFAEGTYDNLGIFSDQGCPASDDVSFNDLQEPPPHGMIYYLSMPKASSQLKHPSMTHHDTIIKTTN